MESKSILREVTATAMDFVGLPDAAGDHLDSRADRQAIAFCDGEFETDPMTTEDAAVF
jgi:hypothetical protein